MRPRDHPPIAQSQVKSFGPPGSPRHRVPAPGPHLHLLPALLRRSDVLSKHPSRRQDQKKEYKKRKDPDRENREIAAPPTHYLHGPKRLPDSIVFCKAARQRPNEYSLSSRIYDLRKDRSLNGAA